jgi:hypothetical protein
MGQAPQHAEIGGVIDDGFDPERPALFEVLLAAGVFVADVEAHSDPAGDDPGSEDAGRRRQDPPAEDQLDLFGAAQIQIVSNQGFKERPPVAGLVKHDRARDLDLPHRQVPPIPVRPISGGER